jgi:hypothetical protein
MYTVEYVNPFTGRLIIFKFDNEKEAMQVYTQMWVDWNRYTCTTITINQDTPQPTLSKGNETWTQ